MWTSLHMHIQPARARPGKCFEVSLRFFDHQMNIERKFCNAPTCFHDEGSHCNVWNEMPINHIDVKPVCASRFTCSDLLPKTREIGRENGRSNHVLIHQRGL